MCSKISKIIVEAEIGNKHRIKKEIKADIVKANASIRSTLTFFEHKALLYKLHNLVAIREKKWKAAQEYCDDRRYEFKIITEKELGL